MHSFYHQGSGNQPKLLSATGWQSFTYKVDVILVALDVIEVPEPVVGLHLDAVLVLLGRPVRLVVRIVGRPVPLEVVRLGPIIPEVEALEHRFKESSVLYEN